MLMSDGWANGMDVRVRCARTGLHRRDHHNHCASLCRAGIEPASPGGCTRRPSARGWRAGPCVREEGRMVGIIDPKSSKLHHDATATARRLGAAGRLAGRFGSARRAAFGRRRHRRASLPLRPALLRSRRCRSRSCSAGVVQARSTLPHVVGDPYFTHAASSSIPQSTALKTLTMSGLGGLMKPPAHISNAARGERCILQNGHGADRELCAG